MKRRREACLLHGGQQISSFPVVCASEPQLIDKGQALREISAIHPNFLEDSEEPITTMEKHDRRI